MVRSPPLMLSDCEKSPWLSSGVIIRRWSILRIPLPPLLVGEES